ncbi:hypothetical protein ACMU_11450 [Actibacterium mucosum KCTC 23349]|uniref:Polyketide cyclase n=1 Tax=Actibacterium mucosum KCTC 23349 TaxID=1454373 RepID=A0A037ZKF7_9RHOB|nr:hypothetical protein ACMU_11450 [Actibacterium mucosum KCTC 23349]
MSVLKWIFRIVILVLAVFLIGAFFLPKETSVARSIAIDAPAEEIFPHVANLKATEAWSPWLSRDPEVQLTYGDVAEGVGATMTWASDHPQVGSGNMEIVEATAPSHLKTALDFGDMGTAMAYFDLVAQGDATQVTWGFTSDNGNNPMLRWMGLMMDGWVGPDYQKGLENLKNLVEGA